MAAAARPQTVAPLQAEGRLGRSRVETEIALAEREHRDALARGDEAEARAISMREMALIRTKLGLAN